MVELNREYLNEMYYLKNKSGIVLTNKQIKKVDSNTFKKLTKLERLSLGNNEIEEIDVRLFENLSNLKELRLYNNKLKRIDANTFKQLINLELLRLDNNEIEKIDVSLFESLLNLKELYLHNNKLKRIDSYTFKQLVNLEVLKLNHNEIEEIEVKSFKYLSKLRELNLSNNKLKGIDSSAFKSLNELNTLYLNNNEITQIDSKSFANLSNLSWLLLHNNKLNEIDRRTFEPLKSVKLISLYENDFKFNSYYYLYKYEEIFYMLGQYGELIGKIYKHGFEIDWGKFLAQFHQSNQTIEANKISTQRINRTIKADSKAQDLYIGKKFKDRYEVKKQLGQGAFGSVYLVLDIAIKAEKAMKIMDSLDSVAENELMIFWEVSHENIVRYFDHFQIRFGEVKKTFLITEFCEKGDLANKIKTIKDSNHEFKESQILKWMCQATNALNYLHSKEPQPIIHRDIKPANMLLTGLNHIKLADLGVAKVMETTHATTHAGTPQYMSPEVFKALFMDDIVYYPNTDIWSLGCVLYELLFLKRAFPNGQRGNPNLPSDISNSDLFSIILPKMLEKDQKLRIKSKDLLAELENLVDFVAAD